MPRKCTICHHPNRDDIDQALVRREAFRHIATRFQVSTGALVRHADDHLPVTLLQAHRAADVAHADQILSEGLELRDRALGILKKAEDLEDLRAACAAIREARGCLELLGKLAGRLQDGPTVNIFMSAEWQTVQVAILQALAPHSAARQAVVAALDVAVISHEAGHA
jgi:hypothetical protein